jgi:Fuc2NAc and GlcNAc transferase
MLSALLVAFGVALALTPVVRTLARRLGMMDQPGPRSSHRNPTPRGGGVAILVAMLAGVAVTGAWSSGGKVPALLAGASLVAVVGLADDRFGLPPLPRLLAQGLAALLVVRATGGLDRLPLPRPLDIDLPVGLGSALAVLWVVAAVNFYNFMDGIDALAALQAIVTSGALALAFAAAAPAPALVAVMLAGAAAGFLVYNRPPASIFMGDVGSGLLGYTLASLALLAPPDRRSEAVVLVAASLILFLADATSCLAGRVKRGERWLEAHRQHLYQRWTATGASHGTVSGWLGGGALVTTGLALAGWWTGRPFLYWTALALGAALWGLEWVVVKRRESATSRERGQTPLAP